MGRRRRGGGHAAHGWAKRVPILVGNGIRHGRTITMKKALIIAAAIAGLGLLPSATFAKDKKPPQKVPGQALPQPVVQQLNDDDKDDDGDTDKDGNKRSAERVQENKENRRERQDEKMAQK